MMLLSINNPVYNTIIVFSIIMILLYLTKPDVIYDNERKEFRQFGTTDGKTLLPIYVVGILLAIIMYVFFHYLSLRYKDSNDSNTDKSSKNTTYIIHEPDARYHSENIDDIRLLKKNNEYRLLLQQQQMYQDQQQQQIQQLQNQLNQLIQKQMIEDHCCYHQQSDSSKNKLKSILPNGLSI